MTVQNYSASPDATGTYHLGPENNFTLSTAALSHILDGDTSERPVADDQGKFSHLEIILKGGLHTADGWVKLKSLWPNLVHGGCYLSASNKIWYFARELQNEVILLKIPSEMFQSKAAKLTKFSDVYYKSGFLWKTLFPSKFSTEEIIAAINEALHKKNVEESTDGIFIGYALTSNSMTAMKIRIQLTGNVINSAFPTWEQPNTGNNGKPYTHFDSISFILAESTEFFDEWEDFQGAAKESMFNQKTTYEELCEFTPKILRERKNITTGNNEKRWIRELKEFAENASEHDIKNVQLYCKESFVIKDPYGFLLTCCKFRYNAWKLKPHFENVLDVYQNFIDSLRILGAWDVLKGTCLAEELIFYFIDSKFNRTGGVDFWGSKRILTHIFRYAAQKNSATFSWKIINALSTSPTRTAAYYHFDLNVFFPHDCAVIGLSVPKVAIKTNHLYRFMANLMGPSYFTIWSVAEREKLAKASLTSICENNHDFLLGLMIKHATAADFESFSFLFSDLLTSLSSDISMFDAARFELVIHDYHRMCIESKHRIVADNFEILKNGRDLEMNFERGSAYWKYTKTKHERSYLEMVVGIFIRDYQKICNAAGREDLSEKAETIRNEFPRQRTPLPRKIPDYISSWQDTAVQQPRDINTLINMMFAEDDYII